MKKKELAAVIGLGASVVIGAVAYMVAKKKNKHIAGTPPQRKHSHIRKSRHAHEPDLTA